MRGVGQSGIGNGADEAFISPAACLPPHADSPARHPPCASHGQTANNQNQNNASNLYQIGSSFEIESVLDSASDSCYTLPNVRASKRSVGLRSPADRFDKVGALRYNSALEQAFPQCPGLPRAVERSYASVRSIRNCLRDHETGL